MDDDIGDLHHDGELYFYSNGKMFRVRGMEMVVTDYWRRLDGKIFL